MGRLIILMGPTGAGKSVQAERLVSDLGYVHLSSGELLRRNQRDAAVMASGQLVPSADVEQLVGAAIAAVPSEQSIVLDGFPRTVDEAEWLGEQLPDWQRSIDHVILIDVEQNISSTRLRLRQRGDDTPEALEEKWAEYHTLTQPVITRYAEQGILRTLDGSGTIDEVYQQLTSLLA